MGNFELEFAMLMALLTIVAQLFYIIDKLKHLLRNARAIRGATTEVQKKLESKELARWWFEK